MDVPAALHAYCTALDCTALHDDCMVAALHCTINALNCMLTALHCMLTAVALHGHCFALHGAYCTAQDVYCHALPGAYCTALHDACTTLRACCFAALLILITLGYRSLVKCQLILPNQRLQHSPAHARCCQSLSCSGIVSQLRLRALAITKDSPACAQSCPLLSCPDIVLDLCS